MAGDKGGRPRKPTARRRREGGTKGQGEISHRPLPDAETALVEIAGRDVPVSPPDGLPKYARELWTEIVRVLAEHGMVDKIDLPALRILCVEYARHCQARDVLDEEPDADADAKVERRLADTVAILDAQKVRVANLLRANADVSPSLLNAIANLEVVVSNLEAYLRARTRVGNLVALGSTGQLVAHPLLDVERQAAQIVLRYAGRFGLTPSDRAALGLNLLEGKERAAQLTSILGDSPRDRK